MIKALPTIEKEFNMKEVEHANPSWLRTVMIIFLALIIMGAVWADWANAAKAPPLVKKNQTCTIKQNSLIVVFTGKGPLPLIAHEDTDIVVIEILLNVESSKPNQPLRDFIKFSLKQAKPKIRCTEHGSHDYDYYSVDLTSDFGFIFKEDCINLK